MEKTDIDGLHRIFSDENVLRAFGLDSFSREQMTRWLERNLEHQLRYGYGLWAVMLKSSGELIGDCGLENSEFKGRPCIELGYDFLSSHWNRGYATEAAGAVRDEAVQKLRIGLDSLCSFIRSGNAASQRISEKIGMRRLRGFRRYDTDYSLYAFSGKLAAIPDGRSGSAGG